VAYVHHTLLARVLLAGGCPWPLMPLVQARWAGKAAVPLDLSFHSQSLGFTTDYSNIYERTNINLVVIELANQVYGLVKSVTIDIALLAVVLVFSYAFKGLQVAGMKLFGSSYTFGNLVWLVMLGVIGLVLFDIGDRVSPLLASVVRKRYTGKRALDWDVLARAVTRVATLIAVWLLLIPPVASLVDVLRSQVSPNTVLGLYHILFGLAIAYCAVSGAVESRAPGLKRLEPLSGVSWDGLEEAVRMSQYLKRLEALGSSGHMDERTYDKLRAEYERRLREAIELP